ncbi:Nucleotide-diphospho-sugar transferase [Gracilaria domingensis]|nr:Nucleotide-diphospho-sugar transferase [Gracilaria domingensis]
MVISRRSSQGWSQAGQRKRYVISRYSLTAGKSPYTVRFWLRCFFFSSILTVFASLKLSSTLLHRIKEVPAKVHSSAPFRSTVEIRHFDYSSSEIQSGTSLLTACQNDHEKLRRSLSTWVQQHGLNEIVIVDWGSTPPLQYVVEEVDIDFENHAPIHVVHVQNVTQWIASHALNFAFQSAQYSRILKVSCSHALEPGFVEHHQLQPNSFVAGGSHLERIRDEETLKDILFIERKAIIEIGGYDERLQESGSEREDLIERLSSKGMRRMNLDYDKIKVVEKHTRDEDSLTSHSDRVALEIDLEFRKGTAAWNPLAFNESAILGRKILEEQCRTTKSFRHPLVYYSSVNRSRGVASFREIATPHHLQSVEQVVLSRHLQRDFSLPDCFLRNLDLPSQQHLFASLYNRSTPIPGTKLIIIHCFSSIPSRINLLLSGLILSKQTGRVPIVMWERGLDHNSTRFNSLFEVPQNVVLLQDFSPDSASHWEKCQGKSFASDVALQSAGQKPILFREKQQTVEYVKTDMPVQSKSVKLLNSKLLAKAFNGLQLGVKIEHALRSLKDVGLESSIGVYVGASLKGETSSHAGNLEIFTAVQEEIASIRHRQKSGMEAKVYVDASKIFVHRFHKEEKRMIDNAWLLESRDNELAFSDYLTRIVALSRTETFSSFSDDDTSMLIELLRSS